MAKLPKGELVVKERQVPHGDDKCKCGHLKKYHVGGRYDCDVCFCEDFIDAAEQLSDYEEYERS